MIINKYFHKLNDLFVSFNNDTKSYRYISDVSVGFIRSYDETRNSTHLFYINLFRADDSCTSYCYYNNDNAIADEISKYFNKYVADDDDVKYKLTQLAIVSYLLVNRV